MNGTEKWILALSFGALVVGMYSWARFDEPSYDSHSEFITRYAPRFSTSAKRYWRAKWGYIAAITLVFLIFSTVPEIFRALLPNLSDGNQAKLGEVWVPLAAALALMTLENMPILKDAERKIRAFLHAVARIPECIRRTVAQMKSSPFNFTPRTIAALTRKLDVPSGSNNQPEANFTAVLAEDDLVHTWYTVGALLCVLSERNRDQTGIEPLFFESHKDELESIADKHTALAELVRRHLLQRSLSEAADSSMPREVRELRDRLYTFIACGVHSSIKADAQSLEIIKRLGFAIRPSNERKTSFVAQLAGLALAALMVVSALAGYSTQIFRNLVILPVDLSWRMAFPMPAETLAIYAWSWTTALFYFAAIMGALAVRNSRVAKREWFDITNLQRETPILRYITPTLVGTALGFVTLSAVALIGGPAFKAASFGDFGKAAVASFDQTLPWAPLATVMAFISVALSDSRFKNGEFWNAALVRATCGAAAMALVGFFTSELSVTTAIARQSSQTPPDQVIRVGHYLSIFIAAQIGLFAFVLCLIAQVAERYTARARCFAGHCVEVATRQGSEFRMYFDSNGSASLFPRVQGDSHAAPVQWRGQWQLFPEGTAVRWNIAEGETCKAGEFGLISWYGDSLIYEGYAEGFAGTADFVGQVHVRTAIDDGTNRLVENARTIANGSPLAPTGQMTPQSALSSTAGEEAMA